jgi:cytochrome P450
LLLQTTSREELRTECLNILLAGRDTVSSLLSNLFFTLARRPDIQAKLRTEIAQLSSDSMGYEEIKDLKYLRAFINESLRLHPVVPGNARECVKDTMLPVGGGPDEKGKVFVAKGSIIGWSLWAMHRRKDIYGDDAEEFKPERWIDTPEAKGIRPGWSFLPFNGGPRICIGRKFYFTNLLRSMADPITRTICNYRGFLRIDSLSSRIL